MIECNLPGRGRDIALMRDVRGRFGTAWLAVLLAYPDVDTSTFPVLAYDPALGHYRVFRPSSLP